MMTPLMRESALEAMRQRCREEGLAFTFQRQAIYEAVLDSREHPTPENIYEEVRGRIPSISLATVYKNVRTFLDHGLLKELSLHHGTLRLEANTSPHHHLVCSRCKAIFDLDESLVSPVCVPGELPGGFESHRVRLEIVGICRACASANSSQQQTSQDPSDLHHPKEQS